MPMLVFLDLDGVMIPAKPWKTPELLDDGFSAFSARAVLAMQQLLNSGTILKIILTSSHKARYSAAEWMELFARRGIQTSGLLCLPENRDRLSRKDEILRWIEHHPPAGPILILDDDASLNELPTALKSRFVQTSPFIGFTDEQLQQIARLPQH